MTLIVGLKFTDRVQLISDTRVSHPDVTQVEEIPGRLKVVLLNPDIAVGYAGTADHSLDIIRGAPKNVTLDDTLRYFLDAHVASAESMDFIVGCASKLTLYCIRDGGVDLTHKECWIGAAEGYREYSAQKATANVPPDQPPDLERIIRAVHSFGKLLEHRAVPSVSGFMQRVGSTREGFTYLPYAAAYCPPQVVPSGVRTTLSFGTAVHGGFAYTILVPQAHGVSIVAVHLFQGRLGFVYVPLLADRPIEITNVSHEGLKQTVLQRFGVTVDGPRIG